MLVKISCKKQFVLLFSCAVGMLLVAQTSLASRNLLVSSDELQDISDFADRVCPKFHESGEENVVELSGKAKAELPGLIKKLVNLGFEGAAKYGRKSYQGMLQIDVLEAIKHRMDCKVDIVKMLIYKLIRNTSPNPGVIEATPSTASAAKVDRKELLSAFKDLGAMQNSIPDIRTRKVALYSLLMTGQEAPDADTKSLIVEELQDYIRDNVGNWKYGEGGRRDSRFHETDDIVIALQALQKIRRSSDGKVPVILKSINFDNYNLGDHDLEGFDFTHSSFKNGNLSSSRMKGAIFDHANLSAVAIWNADMSHASFIKANLNNAKFATVQLAGSNIEKAADRSVALFGVQGLTEKQKAHFPRFDG